MLFLFGAEGETRKALPCVCYANNRVCRLRREEFESLYQLFENKNKKDTQRYPFYLAQKERLELSRRFPDLRP